MNSQQPILHLRHAVNQRGAVLVVSLMILLVMTIISITALRTTSMDEKMASNARQQQIAFNAAEMALREAEAVLLAKRQAWLVAGPNTSYLGGNDSAIGDDFFGSTPGLYAQAAVGSGNATTNPAGWDPRNDNNWLATNHSVAVSALSLGQARYRIEYIGKENPLGAGGKDNSSLDPSGNGVPPLYNYVFRITAIGWGQETAARSLLSSTFRLTK